MKNIEQLAEALACAAEAERLLLAVCIRLDYNVAANRLIIRDTPGMSQEQLYAAIESWNVRKRLTHDD